MHYHSYVKPEQKRWSLTMYFFIIMQIHFFFLLFYLLLELIKSFIHINILVIFLDKSFVNVYQR